MNFWANYAVALAVVGLVLTVFAIAGRFLNRRAGSRGAGHIAIVESVMLAPRVSLHVVKAGRRHLLIGSADGHVCALTEIELGSPSARG